jgi:hypothetical protein
VLVPFALANQPAVRMPDCPRALITRIERQLAAHELCTAEHQRATVLVFLTGLHRVPGADALTFTDTLLNAYGNSRRVLFIATSVLGAPVNYTKVLGSHTLLCTAADSVQKAYVQLEAVEQLSALTVRGVQSSLPAAADLRNFSAAACSRFEHLTPTKFDLRAAVIALQVLPVA